MYIKSVILDGFKSYAQRTEVNGFDPLFNAITGLNGSGKSNILDSICFLLGITNLSHVRATNLQELIYKSGQAGVTKATVTITFDNTDKKQSPIGYETFDEITISRQIVLGGRNKYLINGCNANNTRVQDLFRSVQLNVNNPHFLIMQGRITKVLNMKPPEILSMIEEAAGTRMYESKKQQAIKTMEKKQSKLNEIESVLHEEITPTIKKLKEERSSYLEYQKIMREIEHLTRLCVAYEFVKAQDIKQKSSSELETMTNTINVLKERSVEIDQEIAVIDAEIVKLQKQKDAESGNVLKELEKKLDEVSKIEVKASSDLKHAKDTLNAEKKKKKSLEKNITDNNSQMEAKGKSSNKLKNNLEVLEEKSKTDAELVTDAQNHYHAVSAGLSSNDDGEDKTLADQMMDCKNAASKAETEVKQAQIKLKHEESELKRKQADLKSTAKNYEKDTAAFDALEKERNKLQSQLEKLNYEEGKEEQLVASRRQLQTEVTNLENNVETLEARFPNLQFQYEDPEPRFDRRKVKGLVCNLIKVKDIEYATGVQVAAGAKLYNVVVDTERTGKQLLERGQLKRKVTLIPLNKIAHRSISQDVINKAKSVVGKENVHTALSLVGYDNEVESAMRFVFGSAFVAKTLDCAKKVAFDPQVKTKTVTMEGDVFDPAGTLSGGARASQTSILVKLQELQDASAQLHLKKTEFAKVDHELKGIKSVADRYNQLSTQLDMKSREVELVQERLKQSTHHLKVEELKSHENSIVEQKEIIKQANETKKNATSKCKDLELKMKEKAAYREKELKNAESALTKAKQKAEMSLKEFKSKQQELEELHLEVEVLTGEIKALEDQIKAIDEGMKPMEEEITSLSEVAATKKAAVKDAEEKLANQKEALRLCSENITTKSKEKGQLLKEASNGQLKFKELEHKITKINKDSHDAAQRVELMLDKYEWIRNEQQYFGQANTAYDFKANDPKEASKRLNRLNESKDKLGKNVNMRAMNMLGKAEEKYNDLMKKKRIVENDKEKIEDVIRELDEKKNEALRQAWVKVNKDFGSIFSTLLPGSNAKLSPPEGQGVLDGLEVKVAFGNVWKESLTELSGGQRSLVALSLILSMLLFKPAPIYILDEVDAALDLSHTQNIGQMLRQHFQHSQFIVVSLKDGMFNNANVLFKTKFVDGVSTVARFVQNQAHRDAPKQPLLSENKKRRK
ncbi:structural maintenance of chromosomes protein 2-like [Hydractinia symbiolongicarpus]|uniref:structural maintenance of chromosomes protein 2-like n=1 Tax=Hydractinia symbiolongicarpus TaxID=13093 RepID=UPI00254B3E0D|nr:structural maintenance of chromosomes protein 2-like [Hydractinia symbiolongicarpus]